MKPEDKSFDIPKKEAIRLVGKSEKTLQRWTSEGLLHVDYKNGPYGREAYYNRDELLKLRRGKPGRSGDAPLAKADLAVIARGAEWSNQQLTQALQNISQQLPVIQEQLKELVKAKDETIKAKEEQGELKEQLGALKQFKEEYHSVSRQLEKLRARLNLQPLFMVLLALLAFALGLLVSPETRQALTNLFANLFPGQ